jgi:tetratricopeptide (TPR) repeat protein
MRKAFSLSITSRSLKRTHRIMRTVIHSLSIIAVLISSLRVEGQDVSRLPDLRQTLAKAKSDTARAMALSEIGFNLIHSEPDTARAYLNKALALAEQSGGLKAIAKARINLAWLETKQGHYDLAKPLSNEALSGARKLNDPGLIATILSVHGAMSDLQGDRVGALKAYQDAEHHAQLAHDTTAISSLLFSIGTTYKKMKDTARARALFEKALGYIRTTGNKLQEANCLISIGNTWNDDGKVDLALAYYAKAGVLYDAIGDHYGAGLVEENSGDLFVATSPRKALPYLLRALEHYDALGSPLDKAYVLKQIGKVQRLLGEFDKAKASYDQGMILARSTHTPTLEMAYDLELAELAVMQGRSDVALVHYQRHMALKDSLHSAEAQSELMRLRATFETEQAEKENALLKSENDLRRLNEERLRNRWFAATALALLLAGFLGLLWRTYSQRGRHTREVERFNAEIQIQRDQVQRVNDLLELRVLRAQLNPHFIHNCQNSAIALVKEGRDKEALAYLQGLSKLMRAVLEQSVKDRITLDEELAFLRQYLALEALRLKDLNYVVEADEALLKEEVFLPALLVQPFVENAIWHGLAAKDGDRRVQVHFRAVPEGLRCTVTDNGIGRQGTTSRGEGDRSYATELTQERLLLLTHRMQQKGSIAINDLQDAAGRSTGTEVLIDLSL